MAVFSNSHKGTNGIDCSQYGYPINWNTAYAQGARFAMMRCGRRLSGGLTPDSQFTTGNVQAARAAGLKVGFYWFKNPDLYSKNTLSDAEEEAQTFFNYISSVVSSTDMGDCFPVCDYENSSGSITSVTNDEAYLWIKQFCDYFTSVTAAANPTGVGRQCMLYTAFYSIDALAADGSELIYSSTGATIASTAPLWLAANSSPYVAYNFTQFGGYTDWVMWQYVTDTSGYGSSNIDVNDAGHISTIAIPPQCTGFNATVVSSTATLRWNQNAYDGTGLEVIAYRVYDITSTPYLASSIPAASAATYSTTYTGLSVGTWSYKLVAVNSYDEGFGVETSAVIGASTLQATINIDNVNFVSGAAFRGGMNNAFETIANCWAGPSSPTETYPYQFWADTANGKMQQRNAANDAWIELYTLGATLGATDPSGWTSAGETWTWVDGTTFTASGDRTGVYQKGDKIKLTSGSTVYSYLVSVTYTGASTTFITTVWADTTGASATFATGAISDNYYSRVERPFGFPDYIPYAIDLVSNSATFTTNTGSRAYFKLNGIECKLRISAYGSVGTTATYLLHGTYPTNLAPDDVSYIFKYSGADLLTFSGGSYYIAGSFVNPNAEWFAGSTTHFTVYRVGSVGVPFSANTAQTGFAGTITYNYN
jgi:GH25 family lysozyme M1 (1,4-beta-N-acetylmuramidase)